jgi:hypothetical protein
MTATGWVAALVLIAVASVTGWALRRSPDFFGEFRTVWGLPWGKQVVIDFYGLEIVLALFMVTHAAASGTWLTLVVCLVLMPVFGSMAAAAYWLFAVA